MVLEEKNISYRVIEENLAQKSPELLALHPEGKVPLLVHHLESGAQTIYQSTIITEYLDDVFPQVSLLPQDPVQRAQVRIWTYWCDYIFKPDLDLFKYKLPMLREEEISVLRSRLHACLNTWEQALKTSSFLIGDKLTLADIHLFPFARQFFNIKQPLEGIETYTRVREWLDALVSRPAFERVMR